MKILCLILLLVISSYAQLTPEQKEKCKTKEGRLAMLEATSKENLFDMWAQSDASGMDFEQFKKRYFDILCGYSLDETEVEEVPKWRIDKDNMIVPGEGIANVFWKEPFDCPKAECVVSGELEIPKHTKICNFNFKSDFYSTAPYPLRNPKASISPRGWLGDSAGFTSIFLEAEKTRINYVKISEMIMHLVDRSRTLEQMQKLGCEFISPDISPKLAYGSCSYNKRKFRLTESCDFVHRAEASRVRIFRAAMRKAIISKSSDDSGEETIDVYSGDYISKRFTLKAGETIKLINFSGSRFVSATIEVITTKVGSNGKSRFNLSVETSD